MKRSLLVLLCALAVVAAACGASGDEGSQGEEEETATTSASGADNANFGDLESPCGEGDATVAEGEGPSTDTLQIGVANDRGADAVGRPGLNKELWDASQAYAKWCNDQGGLQGLPIELVDLDGKAIEVETAMTTACDSVFAMVGGGFAQDALEFSEKPGSDFHECELIDIPGFAVSIEKSLSNGKVEPIPNLADQVSTQWVQDFQQLYPEDSENMVIVYGDLPSLTTIKTQFEAAAEDVGIPLKDPILYPLLPPVDDWGTYADLVIESGATSIYWIGEPVNAANLQQALAQKEWEGTVLHQTNSYDNALFSAGPEAVEGSVVRTAFHPFEEADDWPAIAQYQELMSQIDGAKENAALGLQSMSAWLLFSVAANACAESNDGVIDRECVLSESAAVEDWTAGGLHAPTDPGGDPPECGMLLVVKDGGFERLYPEVGGEGDDQDGYHCPEDSVIAVDVSDLGEGAVDPDRPEL